jgi:hypothetical protein
MAALKYDLSKLTTEEKLTFEALAIKAGASDLSNREYRTKCLAVKSLLETEAQKHGVTLADISAASAKWYRSPEGKTYSKGKRPDWLPENEDKRGPFEDKITAEEINAVFASLMPKPKARIS